MVFYQHTNRGWTDYILNVPPDKHTVSVHDQDVEYKKGYNQAIKDILKLNNFKEYGYLVVT